MINKIKSYAKINLALNIVGKNSVLHKIESIIAFIELHDVIKISLTNSKKHNISFYGKFSKNISSNNTVTNLLKTHVFITNKKQFLKEALFQCSYFANKSKCRRTKICQSKIISLTQAETLYTSIL